jgi:hypothetical protein
VAGRFAVFLSLERGDFSRFFARELLERGLFRRFFLRRGVVALVG